MADIKTESEWAGQMLLTQVFIYSFVYSFLNVVIISLKSKINWKELKGFVLSNSIQNNSEIYIRLRKITIIKH